MQPTTNSSSLALASPFVWMMAGSTIFLIAFLFPPRLYELLFFESNRFYLDLLSASYCAACILAIFSGVVLVRVLNKSRSINSTSVSPLELTPLTLWSLIIVCALLTVGAMALMFKNGVISAFVQSAVNGGGLNSEIRKLSEDSEGASWLTLLSPVAFALPLIYHCTRSVPRQIWERRAFYFLVAIFAVAAILASKRNYLVRPMFGFLLIYCVWPSDRNFSLGKGLRLCFIFGVLGLTLFVSLSFLRLGSNKSKDAVGEVLRYLVTPYSTGAYVINDEIRFEGKHTAYFWTQFIWSWPVLTNVFGLEKIRENWLGPAPPFGAYDRGDILKDSGVNTVTNIPAFACSYIDFGWFGILPFFIVGVLCGLAWRSFLNCQIAGICFYPVIAYSFAEWRANLLFPSSVFGAYISVYLAVVLAMFIEQSIRRPIRTVGNFRSAG